MNAESVKFIEHTGPGEWDNYLMMNLAFPPVAEVFKQLLVKEKTQLTSRGEAHLTIITPVEYWKVLRLAPAEITMNEINDLARKSKIQSLSFKPICVGEASAPVEEKTERTFYIVVESKEVMKLRETIRQLYLSRGGEPKMFNSSEGFYPHITVGFTKKDLYESDKVRKNKETCKFELDLI